MNYIGISSGYHDAALSIVDINGNILFAGHSERYTKKKHDKNISHELIVDALQYADNDIEINYYERPWIKFLRQIYAGENVKLDNLMIEKQIGLGKLLKKTNIKTHGHHLSHAAAGFQTSPFNDATVVVIDAIGEFDTITIWDAFYNNDGIAKYKKIYSKKYPNSIGLFYSAMTQKVGLKPLDEEYILMGMAAYGKPTHVEDMERDLIKNFGNFDFKENLHIGVDSQWLLNANDMDIACSAQVVVESFIKEIMKKAKSIGKSSNLVYGGGVALNCLANRLIGEYFENIWIMPNPSDAGSSLGAAALGYKKQLNWKNTYLGYDIKGKYPIDEIINELQNTKICGVANGRAEFGPRALGNRSLLADPRGHEIKDKVNEIKRRQKFRPFAPVILEEHLNDYFEMPKNWKNSRYMQVVAKCKFPNLYPAITHVDGTSRVQTVPNDNSGIRLLLEKWYSLTGCPMLLNTSLNIRGEPMVNDRKDADRFEKLYGVKVFS
jgi:carbamoyltransferase